MVDTCDGDEDEEDDMKWMCHDCDLITTSTTTTSPSTTTTTVLCCITDHHSTPHQ